MVTHGHAWSRRPIPTYLLRTGCMGEQTRRLPPLFFLRALEVRGGKRVAMRVSPEIMGLKGNLRLGRFNATVTLIVSRDMEEGL